ncbi:MAG: YkgJ family cysteine cluster protein [Planctomycetaceae bacterium]|nr:YkgJ family cysteine cluster protein [Planctomycetaceae bacterium]
MAASSPDSEIPSTPPVDSTTASGDSSTGKPALQRESSGEPWYKDGLPFTCTQCGDCCTGAPGVVWVTDAELQEIAKHLDKPIGEIRLFHTRIVRGRVSLTEYENGDCTFFDSRSRKCTVYSSRPIQCRTWPFWNSHLTSREAWQRVCDTCPGAGQGTIVPLERIQERAAQIDM